MTDPTLETLTRRLDRLDRNSRLWRLAALVVVVTLGCTLLTGAASPQPADRIVAKSISVLDGISIVDAKGRPTILLANTDTGPSIGLLHEGKVRLALSARADFATVEFYAADGKNSRVELRVDEADNPVLLMLDPHNVIRMQLVVAKDGKPNIKLFDEKKRPRAILAVANEEGDAGLVLLDRDGKAIGGVVPQR